MNTPCRSIEERIRDAEKRASNLIEAGNDALERGDREEAEQCFEESEYRCCIANNLWLGYPAGRYNQPGKGL